MKHRTGGIVDAHQAAQMVFEQVAVEQDIVEEVRAYRAERRKRGAI